MCVCVFATEECWKHSGFHDVSCDFPTSILCSLGCQRPQPWLKPTAHAWILLKAVDAAVKSLTNSSKFICETSRIMFFATLTRIPMALIPWCWSHYPTPSPIDGLGGRVRVEDITIDVHVDPGGVRILTAGVGRVFGIQKRLHNMYK